MEPVVVSTSTRGSDVCSFRIEEPVWFVCVVRVVQFMHIIMGEVLLRTL